MAADTCTDTGRLLSQADIEARNQSKVVVFLYHRGSTYPRLERRLVTNPTFGTVFTKLSRYLEGRRNPRDQAYMERLAARMRHDLTADRIRIVEGNELSLLNWGELDEVVLLWADGNGTGWSAIERQVFMRRSASTRVSVLNGRGRFFQLTPKTWRQFRRRRFLEKSFIPEFGILLLFLVTAPALAIWDLALGRR